MARLIQLTVYAVNSTVYSSASPVSINADNIISVRNATLNAKKSVPAASGSINSAVITNVKDNNEGVNSSYLVAETQSALITASA